MDAPSTDLVEAQPDRWTLIRDMAIFQLKLTLDALRDLVIFPVSIVAGLADLLIGGEPTGRNFYRVYAFGRRTDVWINLFGEHTEPTGETEVTVDQLMRVVEKRIVEQYERGGLTASAKDAIDRSLDSLAREYRANQPPTVDRRSKS